MGYFFVKKSTLFCMKLIEYIILYGQTPDV
jgi:hypothetical protein